MNDDDLELFLEEMRSVKPLSQVRIDKNNKRSLMKDESKKTLEAMLRASRLRPSQCSSYPRYLK